MKELNFFTEKVAQQNILNDEAEQNFFKQWFRECGLLNMRIVERQEWDELEKIVDEESHAIILPKDLKIYEIPAVLEAIGIYSEDGYARRIEELGEKFKKAGVYLAKRLNAVSDGRDIAEIVAREFYDYGESVLSGKADDNGVDLEYIASQDISAEDEKMVDQFLAGDKLYASRLKRVNDDGSDIEVVRNETLAQFFRVLQKTFDLEREDRDEKKLRVAAHSIKPWEEHQPIHVKFIDKIEKAINTKFEAPKSELIGSALARGRELLKERMQKWNDAEKTLREALSVDELRRDLENIRATGNMERIVQKEHDIADIIQKAVRQYTYHTQVSSPRQILQEVQVNCVGASLVGGMLLKDVGLDYLVASIPSHSVLLLVTSDGAV